MCYCYRRKCTLRESCVCSLSLKYTYDKSYMLLYWHKYIEDLLISSRQVISSISSSGLGSQGSSTNLGGAASTDNIQEITVLGGADRCSPGSGSDIPSRPSPKENCRREYSRLNSNSASKDSSNMSKSDEQQSREVTNKPIDPAHSLRATHDGKKESRGERSKKKSSWYNVLYPTYKSRSEDFKRLFKDVPDDERLVVDYSCALQRDTILAQGRLYVSQNYVCFYANIFSWETMVSLRWKDVTSITKEKTAIVLPNAISICTATDKFFLTSFGARDKIYVMLFRVWQNALIGEPMSASEMWQLVHACYGDELGLTSDDEDYIPSLPPAEEEKMPTRASVESFSEAEVISPENPAILNMGNSPSQLEMEIPAPRTEPAVEVNDLSDTTDNEAQKGSKTEVPEITVCNSSHEGRLISKATLPIHIDQLFRLLFTNSKFFLDFHTARKTTDLVQSAWTQDDETAQKTRTLSLTIALSQAIGPKNTRVSETQVLLPCSKPGQLYSIDVESVNAGIPYADSFSVLTHYCLSSISENETSIAMYSQIKYKKSVWGLVKSVIEKNCWAGLEEYFNSLIKALSAECEESSVNGGVKREARRRRRTPTIVTALQNHSPNHTITNHQITSSTDIPHIHDNPVPGARTDSNMIISSMLLVAILCLMVINGLLYYKLWGLEEAAAYTIMDLHVLKNTPKTEEDWLNLLQHQESLHNIEMRKWQRVLHTAAQLLRQTEESLTELQMSIHPTVTEKMFSVLKPNLKSINTRTEQRSNSEL